VRYAPPEYYFERLGAPLKIQFGVEKVAVEESIWQHPDNSVREITGRI